VDDKIIVFRFNAFWNYAIFLPKINLFWRFLRENQSGVTLHPRLVY